MSQEESKKTSRSTDDESQGKSDAPDPLDSIHRQLTRPTAPVGMTSENLPDIDEGPRAGPVDEIQEALFEAAQAGLSTEVQFEELSDPVPEIDEGPRPGPVDEVQAAIFSAAQEGISTDVDLDSLPAPDPPINRKVVKFKSKTPEPESEEEPSSEEILSEEPFPEESDSPDRDGETIPQAPLPEEEATPEQDAAQDDEVPDEEFQAEPPPDEISQPEPEPEPQEPALVSITSEFWFILAIFVSFRVLTLFLLRPGGFIRDWSDFDTYFGIAALSDYGLFPFTHFWLEWPPLVPWLSVGVYQLALLLPPWPDDPRLWFILMLGGIFILFEIGNFVLIYRLARRLFQDPAIINRVLWLYAGLFMPVYAMLGFFDGIALFFILLALDLLLNQQRFPSAIAAGVGVMVKIIPGLMLPVAARQIWHKHRHNNKDATIEIGLYIVAFGLTIVILLLPFLIVGPQKVLTSTQAMLGRSAWETIWAVSDGYYGFGKIEGDRWLTVPEMKAELIKKAGEENRNVDERKLENVFAAYHGKWLSDWWWLITLAFAGLYAFIFTRKADYSKSRNVVAFSGLTVAILMLYSKGYSPQFLVYLLPFIVLLMPNGRGLTYALVLTGLNILEQPIYFVLLPDAAWLLTFVVITRFVLTIVIAIEFALAIWPIQEENPVLAQTQRYTPHVFAGLGVLSLVILTPLMLQAYSNSQSANSLVGDMTGFMQAQAQNSQANSGKPRLIFSDQATYRQLYPHLRQSFDLQLSDGPDKGFTGAPTLTELTQGRNQVWVLPTGPQQAALANTIAAQGVELAAYNFDGLGTVSLYSLEQNPLPTIPPARFIGGIELLGHQVEYQPDAIDLTLYWRAGAPQNQKLTVFTQLLNKDGELVAGHDSVPDNGNAPVTAWTTGTVLADSHRILLSPDLPPGQYTLVTGLYNNFNERVRSIDQTGAGYANRAVSLRVVDLQ